MIPFVAVLTFVATLAAAESTGDLDVASNAQPQYHQYRTATPQRIAPQQHNAAFNIPPPPQLYHQQTQLGSRNSAYDFVDQTQLAQTRPVAYQATEENYPQGFVRQQAVAQKKVHQKKPVNGQKARFDLDDERKLQEEEELEEPDRLTLLLPNSKFDCAGKKTGYYADVGLDCEVFHYCQDNAKHSWICPEGFSFHQVHLICMPQSADNICTKSADFHFVNEYLYKAINEDEHERKPNISLKYADRYFPENYFYDNLVGEPEQDYYDHSKQVPQTPANYQNRRPHEYQHAAASSAKNVQLRGSGQVFHSPEEVNISLQQRRPFYFQQ